MTIKAGWEEARDLADLQSLGAEPVKLLRQMYYAGAQQAVLDVLRSDKETVKESLMDIHVECLAFIREIEGRRN